MLFKIAFRVALAAGVLYGAKKVLDRTGATDKLIELGTSAVDTIHAAGLTVIGKVVDVLDGGLDYFADNEAEAEEAMSTPQAAQWAASNMGAKASETGGAGGKF